MDVEPADRRRQAVQALAALGLGHVEGRRQRLGQAVGVVGVDHQRPVEVVGRAGQLAQDQDPAASAGGADGGELVGHQVHPVAQRGHEGDVRSAVEGRQVGLVERLVAVADRHPRALRKPAVDAARGLVHVAAQAVVGRHARPAGRGDLDERDRPVALGEALQKPLVGLHAQEQALGVVQAVHAEHDLDVAQVVAEVVGGGGRLRPGRQAGEAAHVDADGVRLGAHAAPVPDDGLTVDLGPQQVARRLAEVLGVAPRCGTPAGPPRAARRSGPAPTAGSGTPRRAGHGTCQKNPIRASGRPARIISGTSMVW